MGSLVWQGFVMHITSVNNAMSVTWAVKIANNNDWHDCRAIASDGAGGLLVAGKMQGTTSVADGLSGAVSLTTQSGKKNVRPPRCVAARACAHAPRFTAAAIARSRRRRSRCG